MQDTHYYDTKLDCTKKELEAEITRVRSIPEEEKKKEFQRLRCLLTPKISPVGLLFFDAIANNPPVYDPINQLWSTDMLYLCCELSKNKDVDLEGLLENLVTQFEDMSSGFCPQGQTIRLLQIVCSFTLKR
jgi:hypothetical protein